MKNMLILSGVIVMGVLLLLSTVVSYGALHSETDDTDFELNYDDDGYGRYSGSDSDSNSSSDSYTETENTDSYSPDLKNNMSLIDFMNVSGKRVWFRGLNDIGSSENPMWLYSDTEIGYIWLEDQGIFTGYDVTGEPLQFKDFSDMTVEEIYTAVENNSLYSNINFYKEDQYKLEIALPDSEALKYTYSLKEIEYAPDKKPGTENKSQMFEIFLEPGMYGGDTYLTKLITYDNDKTGIVLSGIVNEITSGDGEGELQFLATPTSDFFTINISEY